MKPHTKRMKKPNTPNLKPGRQICREQLARMTAAGDPLLDKYVYRPLSRDGRRPYLFPGAYMELGSDGAYFRFTSGLALIKMFEGDRSQLFMRARARGHGGPSRLQIHRFERITLREYLRDPD